MAAELPGTAPRGPLALIPSLLHRRLRLRSTRGGHQPVGNPHEGNEGMEGDLPCH